MHAAAVNTHGAPHLHVLDAGRRDGADGAAEARMADVAAHSVDQPRLAAALVAGRLKDLGLDLRGRMLGGLGPVGRSGVWGGGRGAVSWY